MEIKCFQLVPNDSAEPKEELLMIYTLDEIESIANNDIAKKTNSTVPKVSLSFELSRSQFLKLKQVQVKIDETVIEEIIPEIKNSTNTTETSQKEEDT